MRAAQLGGLGGGLILASLLVIVAKPVPTSRPSHQWTRVVAFGDSLSDNGNGSYKLTHGSWPADPAYCNGRFSNGPTWIEDLALDVVRRGPSGKPVLDKGLLDLAYGGATVNNTRVQGYTGLNSTIPVPSVLEEVREFLKSDASAHLGDTLFMLSGGGNDAFFGVSSSNDVAGFAAAVAEDLFYAVRQLEKKGARSFLVPVAPSLDQTPYAREYASPATQEGLKTFSSSCAVALHNETGRFRSHHPEAKLYLFDQAAAMPLKPSKGFTNVTGPCLSGAYGEATRSLCEDADQHVWWDIYHPTRVTHRAIAKEALKAIHSGPKPRDEPSIGFLVQ